MDGKLPERFDPAKLYVAGTADLKWISEGCKLLVANGLEPLFLSPGTVEQVAFLVTRSREVGLLAHIGATKLGYGKQYTLKLEPFSYVLSLLRTLLTQHPDLYPGATRSNDEEIPGLVNIQKTIENCHLKLISH